MHQFSGLPPFPTKARQIIADSENIYIIQREAGYVEIRIYLVRRDGPLARSSQLINGFGVIPVKERGSKSVGGLGQTGQGVLT